MVHIQNALIFAVLVCTDLFVFSHITYIHKNITVLNSGYDFVCQYFLYIYICS